jgi:hypothetical protein
MGEVLKAVEARFRAVVEQNGTLSRQRDEVSAVGEYIHVFSVLSIVSHVYYPYTGSE